MLTVYKASAGSGKTYNLALEYIKHLLGRHPDNNQSGYILNDPENGGIQRPHTRILAITFTNKATAQMKSRILKQLHALTILPADGQKDADYASTLLKVFGCTREALAKAAEYALRGLLNDYGSFHVSTIDSFFQTVLRSFSHEIDRQGDYRLELDKDTAISQSMSLLFDEVNFNPGTEDNQQLLQWLQAEGEEKLKQGEDYNPFNRTSGMYKEIVGNLSGIFNETFTTVEKQMYDYLSDPEKLKNFERWLKDKIEALQTRESNATRLLGSLSIPPLKKYLQNLVDQTVVQGGMNETIFKPFKARKDYIVAATQPCPDAFFTKKEKYNPSSEELDILSGWVNTMIECFPLRIFYSQIQKSLKSLRTINYIWQFIEKYRQENNIILISDTNNLLKTIIDGSETPFIYERVGSEFKNFLIDEFQDTSRMQWQNLKPLVGTSIDEEDSLIIGDEKQSIYRFRGGDPYLLGTQVSEIDFPDNHVLKGDAPDDNTNHRSAHDIVRFNNTLFHYLSQYNGNIIPGYSHVAQHLAAETKGRNAWIRFNDLRNDSWENTAQKYLTEEEIESLKANGNYKPAYVSLHIMAKTILGEIERGYKQSDIAILVNKNSHGTEVVDFLLQNYGDRLKIISEESLLLRNSPAVKLIISILEMIDSSLDGTFDENSDRDSFAEAMNKTNLYKDDSEREKAIIVNAVRRQRAALADSFEYFVTQGMPFDEALNHAIEASRRIKEGVYDDEDCPANISRDLNNIRKYGSASLSTLVQAIIHYKVNAVDRMQEMKYIASFVDLVETFIQNNTSSVHAFLQYWNEFKDNITVAPGEREDAITVITIHKAKGLEWPCLHIPFLRWSFENEPKALWYDTESLQCPDGVEAPPIVYIPTPRKDINFLNESFSPFKSQLEQSCKNELTDNVNKTYVAFTRAENELHVNMLSTKLSNICTPINDIFSKGIPVDDNNTDLYMDLYSYFNDGCFEFGAPTHPTAKQHKDKGLEEVEVPDFDVSFDNLNKQLSRISDLINAASLGQDVTVDPDASEVVDTLADPRIAEAARQGIIMHAILQQMSTVDDLEDAISRFSGQISPETVEQFRAALGVAFASPDGPVRWFSSDNERILAEQSIYNAESGTTTRADRIVWCPDGKVEVVDYKFTSEVRKEHYVQVRDYAVALKQMGYDATPFLWYPLLGRVVPVEC